MSNPATGTPVTGTPTTPTTEATKAIAAHDEFQWPAFDPFDFNRRDADLPQWLKNAHAAGDFRISDDLGHVRTPEGDEHTVRPGDWIICIKHNGLLAVWSDELHAAFHGLDNGVRRSTAEVQQTAAFEACKKLYGPDPTKWPGWDDNRIHDNGNTQAQDAAHQVEGADQSAGQQSTGTANPRDC
jgi:hypothetical protein